MGYKRKADDVMVGSNGRPVGVVGIPELSRYMGVHCATIIRCIADGRLPQPFRDLRNRRVWRWEDINALIEKMRAQSAAE
jgi:predicted DNA-binding transcriptional regulator AlpA